MDVAVVTPPDKIYDSSIKLLLVYPSSGFKNRLNEYLKDVNCNITIYIYEEAHDNHQPEWLMSLVPQCDMIFYDMDCVPQTVRFLDSWIISNSKTYWLTQGESLFYNLLSRKRIYNYDQFIDKIGGLIGQ